MNEPPGIGPRPARSVLECGSPLPLFHAPGQSGNGLAHAKTWRTLVALCLLLSGLSFPLAAFSQGTTFTYQARLETNGLPVTGTVALRPTLWDALSGGSLVAGNSPTDFLATVTNGLFTATLNFGGAAFDGQPRWLQWEVSQGGGPFTTLTPRQPVTPTPYAMIAGNVSGVIANNSLPASPAFSGDVSAGSFSGSGVGLTGLDAGQLTTGTVPDGRLSANIARTNQVWFLNGNAGTAPGAHYLGTSDNQPLELRVNGGRAFRLEAVANSFGNTNLVNVIAGSSNNFVANGIRGATISGGGALRYNTDPAMTNTIRDNMGTIGGGAGNTVAANAQGGTIAGGIQNWMGGAYATIAGGYQNTNTGQNSAIGGGYQNVVGDTGTVAGGQRNAASGFAAAVGGGVLNVAGGDRSFVGCGWQNDVQSQYGTISGGSLNSISITAGAGTIGGGLQNFVSGLYATVPGGFFNAASGNFSFAAGRQAKAYHQSSFVWADSPGGNGLDFSSTSSNQFLIRAGGGVGIGTNSPAEALHVVGNILATGTVTGSSDRNLKQDFAPVDGRAVLDKVAALPISTWSYLADDGVRHLGPMAQDFYAAFNVGLNDKTISMVDADGVALAAIQGLNEKVEVRSAKAETRLHQLEAENADLKARLERLEQLLESQLTGGAK